jgi:amidase
MPPMVSAARTPGYRPRPEEDRLNAWTWKCRIEPAAGGVLDGKTVSYKDHIAVAGMPMSFGAFALEGFVPDFDATVVTRVLRGGGAPSSARKAAKRPEGGFGTGGPSGTKAGPQPPTTST